jgi:hypothetical protein
METAEGEKCSIGKYLKGLALRLGEALLASGMSGSSLQWVSGSGKGGYV